MNGYWEILFWAAVLVKQVKWIAIHGNTSLAVGLGHGMNGYWEILFWAAILGSVSVLIKQLFGD